MRTLVIIPAYNEQKSINNTILDIQKNAPDVDFIVINDCSLDKTQDVLRDLNVNYLDLPINLGIGGSVQAGYRYALENGYDIAVQFDGDGQHMAQYIRCIIAPIETGVADVVIGSRFIDKNGFQSSAVRRLGIKFLSSLINVLCGLKITDVTSGFRAVNRKLIKVFSEHYAQDYPEPEAVLLCGLLGVQILEISVEMRQRLHGKSSINFFRSLYYMIKVTLALIIKRFGTRWVEVK